MLSEDHRRWLEKRGIDPKIAEQYGLSSESKRVDGRPRSGIVIPYRKNEITVTKKVRWLDCGEPKWTHLNGGKTLWNEDVVTSSDHNELPLIITEGEWDALVAIQAGYLRTVSIPCGANSKFEFSDNLQRHIAECRRVVLCADNDESGRELNAELSRRIGAARCVRLVYPPDCKDLNEILLMYGKDAVHEVIRTAEPYPIKGLYSLDHYPSIARPKIYSTGWKVLDPHLKLWPGEFIVVTGVPNHGKSQFALELLASLNLHHQHRSVIASFEMPVVPYLRDLLREHYHDKRRWQLSDEENGAADVWIDEWARFIDQDPRDDCEEADLEWIIERAEDCVFRHGSNWLLIDPWNQVEHRRDKYENELDYQARAIRALKRFARSYQCGVIVVAHPTKAIVEKNGDLRKPTLYDVSGSANWVNSADHGIIIWRDDLASNRMTVHVAKSRYREAGMPGTAHLVRPAGRLLEAPVDRPATWPPYQDPSLWEYRSD